ncbi:MAG: sigma-70 family RNA polymerase sigma factor [Pseudomonadota bacterium]
MTPERDDDDDHLMQAYALHADTAAFDTLYARHHAGLYRFVRRLLGSALQAQTDEVFQDTWMRVVHARERWSPQGASFRTWLYTLARHRVIDVWRRSGREVSSDASPGTSGQGEDGDAPWEPMASEAWQHWPQPASAQSGHSGEELVFWRRAGERLLDCLDQLPLAQRTAFLLHHEDGLALTEVASALEVGFETAKTRLRYAVSKLRTCMGAYLVPTP